MFTKKVLALGFYALLFLFVVLLSSPADSREVGQDELPPADELTWTNWGAEQFALADDGESIWIGGAGSVLVWRKETGLTQRYGPDVGLAHRKVLAAAADGTGNRWFGGDAGLSRLDPGGVWTHYTSENGGLPAELVDGIAVGADGTLWLSHGLPDGSVSRWNGDGGRQLFPNRNAAVTEAYEEVKETTNSNDLWAVAGDEVWVGYDVYDGSNWENRRPPEGSESPLVIRVDSSDGVWALDRSVIYAWKDNEWLTYSLYFPFGGTATALAVGLDDSVWVGWDERYIYPYVNSTAGISRLPEEPGDVDLQYWLHMPPPVMGLLATAEGLRGIGPGWLLWGQAASYVGDIPRFDKVTDVVMTAEGTLFVHSYYVAPYSSGALQSVDDQGTTRLGDDVWHLSTRLPILTVAEPTPGGDLWVASYDHDRVDYPVAPLRYHQGEWYEVDLPRFEYYDIVSDIFAEDERYTWFAYRGGISRLDDGGTPAAFGDDVWTDYSLASDSEPSAVVFDALGRLWYGDSSGLHFYSAAGWQPYNMEEAVCDMVPAADGTLFVQRGDNCDRPLEDSFSTILIVRPDGGQETKALATLVRDEFERVKTASRRNGLWTVAPDGAIWYPRRSEALGIERYDGANATFYNSPVDEGQYARWTLAVDEVNHVWLVANEQLWRLSPLTDFRLDEQVWLLAPGTSRQRMIGVDAIGGYSGLVSLDVSGLPSGVTATFATNPVAAGEVTKLTLTTDEEMAFGAYEATLSGNDGAVTHIMPFTVMVVPEVYEFYGPVLAVDD